MSPDQKHDPEPDSGRDTPPGPPSNPPPKSDETESLADTEGDLQDFMGSDESEGGDRLDLSQGRQRRDG